MAMAMGKGVALPGLGAGFNPAAVKLKKGPSVSNLPKMVDIIR